MWRDEVARTGDRSHTSHKGLRYTLPVLAVGALGILNALLRVQVHGPSMLPTLEDGDRLLVFPCRRVRVGDLVVFLDPGEADRLLVKRVTQVHAASFEVQGDNSSASRDSRAFGPVARSSLRGVPRYRYFPPARSGRLRRSRQSTS